MVQVVESLERNRSAVRARLASGVLTALGLLGGCGGAERETPPKPEASPVAALRPRIDVGAEDPAPAPPAIEGPTVVVLGIAQDGGLPHPACSCPRCASARKDDRDPVYVASLGLVTETGERLVFDATPDLPDQLHLLRGGARRPGNIDRAPLDGVFLSHAHIGHYLGLAYLGFEAVNAEGTDVHVTPSMHAFLRDNAPWDMLVRNRNIIVHDLRGGAALELGTVKVRAVTVPHRDEYTDTVAYRITGPQRTVLYVPDTDPWARWKTPPEKLFEDVDVALVDGSFYSLDELPGRDVTQIGHPLVVDTMDLLEPRVHAGTLEVHFIHLNHSNPALDPDAPEREKIESRGFHIAQQSQRIAL